MKAHKLQKHFCFFLSLIILFSVAGGVLFTAGGRASVRKAPAENEIDTTTGAHNDDDETEEDVETTGAQDPIDEAKIAAAIAAINAIGEVEYNAECLIRIKSARSAYDALNRREKTLVGNYGTLIIAENTFNNLAQEHNIAIRFVADGAVDGIIDHENRVYFGNYNQQSSDYTEPVLWRILWHSNHKMLLLSDKNLLYEQFHVSNASISWTSCSLRTRLNGSNTGMVGGTNESFFDTAFSSLEQGAVTETDVSSLNDPGGSSSSGMGGMGFGDKVFILSSAEVMNPAFGFPASTGESDTRVAQSTGVVRARAGESIKDSTWWLRDTGSGTFRWVHSTGEVVSSTATEFYKQTDERGVRPALNIDLSRVLLFSPASGGKNANGALARVPEYSGKDWKLTLRDNNYKFNVTQTSASAASGGTVALDYTKAKYGTNDYISAILVSSSGKPLYYGRITQAAAENGTVNVTVPAGLPLGAYKLRVFNEQINGDYYTDRGSAFSDVSLTVTCPHNWQETGVQGNCDTGLTHYYRCALCDEEKTEYENGPIAHEWAEVSRTGNCINGWTVSYSCSVCSAEKSEGVDGPGSHEWTEDHREGSDPEGWTVYYTCLNCAETMTGSIPPDNTDLNAVIAAIGAIGKVEHTAASAALISEARAGYDALSGKKQAQVTNYAVLVAAEEAYDALAQGAGGTGGQGAISVCEVCGETHTGFFGKIEGFCHHVLWVFASLGLIEIGAGTPQAIAFD